MSGDNLSRATIRSHKKLVEIINRFEPHWEAWNSSPFTPLSEKEFQIINSYRSNRSHKLYANTNNCTLRHVASAYQHAIRKLTQLKTIQTFEKWRVHQMLVQKGISTPDYDVNSYVVPAARIQMPYSQFIELFNGMETGKPFIMGSVQMKLLTGLSGHDLQETHKSQLRITIYLSCKGK